MENESDKVSILFLNVFKNVYLRNLIFSHLQNMNTIPFNHFSDNYLGNRISFTLIKSLSWLAKRKQWALLKDKLNNNEDLIIKKNSISTLLDNCKDIQLLKLIYTKKQDQLNQVDLVYLSIETNNFEALQLFSGSFGNEFKVPTDMKSLDKAITYCNIKFIEYLLENRDEGYTKRLLFKNQTDESFIKYILNNPKLYNGEQGLIPFSQFLNFGHLSIPLQMELVDRKLISIEQQNLQSTVKHLQSQYYFPTLLPKCIQCYLHSSYSLDVLYANTYIGDCLLFQIFKDKNLQSLLEYLKNKDIYSKIWSLKLDWSIFKESSVIQLQLINGIIEFENTTRYSQNLNQVLVKLYPISFTDNKQEKEFTLSNVVLPLFLQVCKMGIEHSDLIIKSFYQTEIAENCNIQLFDTLVTLLKSSGTTETRIGYILYSPRIGVGNVNVANTEYNYFGKLINCSPELIIEFIDRCLVYKEFNFNFKSFYTNLKNSLDREGDQQYLDILVKLNLKLIKKNVSLMNESVIQLFNQTRNTIKIQIVNNFLNQFNSFEISNILSELILGINHCNGNEKKEEGIINAIIDIINLWNKGGKLKFNIQTLNLNLLNRLIGNGKNDNVDFTYSIDYFITNCKQDNQLQVMDIIKKFIQFQIENNIYQIKPIGSFSTTDDMSLESIQFLMDEPTYLISYHATSISLNRNLFEILNCLYSTEFQHLFYWDDQIFSNPPILPKQQLQQPSASPSPPQPVVLKKQFVFPPLPRPIPLSPINNEIKNSLLYEIEKGSNQIISQHQFKNDLSKLLSYGRVNDVLYYYKMDKLESKSSRLVIEVPQILKIIKTCKFEIVVEYLNIFLNQDQDPVTIFQCLSHSLKNNRFEIFEYLFSTLNPMDKNIFSFNSEYVQKICGKSGHIPTIKYILSSDMFTNSREQEKRNVVSNLFSWSINYSNFQLFKWLVSPLDNIYYNLINYNLLLKSNDDVLQYIRNFLNPLTKTVYFLNNVENYFK